MNRNLNEAILDIAKADALMYAIENTYLDADDDHDDKEFRNRKTGAFYAVWDAIHKVEEDLDKLSGDCTVVDAIRAVNETT
jgi:hypothetical protein|nr:MAG TPA: hypothetical protein [Caudoviricetes sp.]